MLTHGLKLSEIQQAFETLDHKLAGFMKVLVNSDL